MIIQSLFCRNPLTRWAAVCLLASGTAASLRAHDVILTNVPMQGPMVHVGIAYHAQDQTLHVHLDPSVPALQPLRVSQPDAMFDAGDPWHELLDPHRQGQAFNRQYGFVVDAESDPLPEGVGIWIRQVSATPGLQAFRYRGTDPKAWEPMFGAGGSSPVFAWSLTMFHPAYAAPANTGPHQASYEAFLVTVASGEPVPQVAQAAFSLSWSGSVQETPQLNIAQKLELTWKVTGSGFRLESAPDMDMGPWTPVTHNAIAIEGDWVLLMDPPLTPQFFRLVPGTADSPAGGH